MNIRKLFAILAGVSMVANVALPGLAQAETPDTELGQAYEWARSKEITTMDSYEAANMYGAVTRAQLAKMLSNWAMNVRGLTPDESLACEFNDVASVQGDLKGFVKTSLAYTDNILAISALVIAPYMLALSIGDIVVTPFP